MMQVYHAMVHVYTIDIEIIPGPTHKTGKVRTPMQHRYMHTHNQGDTTTPPPPPEKEKQEKQTNNES